MKCTDAAQESLILLVVGHEHAVGRMRGYVRMLQATDAQRARVQGTTESTGAARRRVKVVSCKALVKSTNAAQEATKNRGRRCMGTPSGGCTATCLCRGQGTRKGRVRKGSQERHAQQGIASTQETARRQWKLRQRRRRPSLPAVVHEHAVERMRGCVYCCKQWTRGRRVRKGTQS